MFIPPFSLLALALSNTLTLTLALPASPATNLNIIHFHSIPHSHPHECTSPDSFCIEGGFAMCVNGIYETFGCATEDVCVSVAVEVEDHVEGGVESDVKIRLGGIEDNVPWPMTSVTATATTTTTVTCVSPSHELESVLQIQSQ